MATAKVKVVEEEDNLLTCSICLEMFKNPKYLPCLHTFCKLCIHSYIQSSVSQEIINLGFKCPVCRTFVPVGEHSSNSECWAEELPNNHLIISMIDRKALQKQDKLCNVCELSNINQEAVSWCSVCQEALCTVCENCHRKFKISSNHKIITLQEVQRDRISYVSGLPTCEYHLEKFVEMFCVDHGQPCCTICAIVKHRECEKVIGIEDAAAGIKETKQTTDVLRSMMQWKTLLVKSIQDSQENVCSVEIMEKTIFSEIEQWKKDLIEHVNNLEKTAKDELIFKKKRIVIELADAMTEMSSLKSTVENWHKILSACIIDGSDVQCFVEFNKLVQKKEQKESEIKNATSNISEQTFSFEMNRVIQNFQKTVKCLGEIIVD